MGARRAAGSVMGKTSHGGTMASRKLEHGDVAL